MRSSPSGAHISFLPYGKSTKRDSLRVKSGSRKRCVADCEYALSAASLMEPFGALPLEVVDANPLKDMVGPWGLEPQTSTVSSSKDRYYNNLQNRGDCQSTRKSYKTYFLWVGLEIRERARLFDAERRSPSQLNSRMLAA